MNRCDKHFSDNLPSIVLADTGVCSVCGQINDVWDLTVIELYGILGIKDAQVHSLGLPRLRNSGILESHLSIQQIEQLAADAISSRDQVHHG